MSSQECGPAPWENSLGSHSLANEFLALLYEWMASADAVAKHTVECTTCLLAEALDGKGYCQTNNELWDIEMRFEAKIQDMLPALRAAGIDVEKEMKGFNFWNKR